MKNIIRKVNIVVIAMLFVIPSFAIASTWDGDYGYTGDFYTYDSGYGYTGDFYTYDDYGYTGDYYTYDDYGYAGDYYTYDSGYGYTGDYYTYDSGYGYTGDYYTYDSGYGYTGDFYTYDDYGYAGDYYTYDDYGYAGDYYTYDSGYGYTGDFYTYDDYGYTGDYYTYDSYYPDSSYNYVTYNDDYYYYDDYYAYDDYYYDDYNYGGGYYGGGYYGGGCSGYCYTPYVPYEPPVVVINDDLDVVCRVSDTRIDEGDYVTFTAEVDGGRGSISYDWDGDISSNSSSVTRRFNSEGDYDVRVTVRDSRGNTASDDCPTVVVEEEDDDDDFDIVCRISDTRIEEDDRIRIEVDIDGGNSPFDIRWSGDDNDIDDFDDDARSQYVRIENEGQYDLRVTVEDDDGRRRTDDCPTIYVDDDYNGGSYSYYGYNYPTYTPSGNYASVDSVFLNQIPYTGPVDNLKLIGFIGLIILWSVAGAYFIVRKVKRTKASNKIAQFKEMNKQSQEV